MKIFLTGYTGFIGKHVLNQLRGNEWYLFDRGEDVKTALTDFTPDVILHLAGEIYKDHEMFDSNIVLTHDLLKYSRFINYKSFIYIGSSSEYGRKNHPMKETDFLDPTNMYEATKGAASLLCLAYARQYNKPISILRPFTLYGKNDRPHKFIPTILKCLRNKQTLNLAEGEHDFIHINDFIQAIKLLIDYPQIGHIFNVGSGTQTSNEEIVRRISKLAKNEIKQKRVARLREYDSECWVADNSKIKQLGWKITKSLTDGLNDLL